MAAGSHSLVASETSYGASSWYGNCPSNSAGGGNTNSTSPVTFTVATSKVGPLANLNVTGPCALDGTLQNFNLVDWGSCNYVSFQNPPSIPATPTTASIPNATLIGNGTVFTATATFEPTGESDDGVNFGGTAPISRSLSSGKILPARGI